MLRAPLSQAPRAAGSSPALDEMGEGKHPGVWEPAGCSPPRCWQKLGWGGPTGGDPLHLTRPVPFCSAGSPEATRHGLMASGICHLIQTTFHQRHPRPATGAACLITPGASSTGAAARGAALPSKHPPHRPPAPSSSSAGPGRRLCPLQGRGQGPNAPRQGTDGRSH